MKLHLRANLGQLKNHSENAQLIRNFSVGDLGALLFESYLGTTDWEDGATLDDAIAEVNNAFAGDYGTFSASASGVITDSSNKPISAIFSSIYEGEPFVIFAFTHPDHKGQGHSSNLIKHAARIFFEEGYDTIHLFVTDSNPAVKLYETLGFRTINQP